MTARAFYDYVPSEATATLFEKTRTCLLANPSLAAKGGATADLAYGATPGAIDGKVVTIGAQATIDLSDTSKYLTTPTSLVVADDDYAVIFVFGNASAYKLELVNKLAAGDSIVVPETYAEGTYALIGYALIHNETGGDFTIGTTATDVTGATTTFTAIYWALDGETVGTVA